MLDGRAGRQVGRRPEADRELLRRRRAGTEHPRLERGELGLGTHEREPVGHGHEERIAEPREPHLAEPADADSNVVETKPIKYVTGFRKGQRLHYPVAEHKVTVAEGNRLVLSLLPSLY